MTFLFAVGASLCEHLWRSGTFGGLEASVPAGILPLTIASLADLSISSMGIQLKQTFRHDGHRVWPSSTFRGAKQLLHLCINSVVIVAV